MIANDNYSPIFCFHSMSVLLMFNINYGIMPYFISCDNDMMYKVNDNDSIYLR